MHPDETADAERDAQQTDRFWEDHQPPAGGRAGVSPLTVPAYRKWGMTANATKLVNSGPTLVHGITILTKGATANVLTLYNGVDNTATESYALDTTAGVGQVPIDVVFDGGLYVELASGTAAKLIIEWLPA